MLDTLIRGARVIDGSGGRSLTPGVGGRGGSVAAGRRGGGAGGGGGRSVTGEGGVGGDRMGGVGGVDEPAGEVVEGGAPMGASRWRWPPASSICTRTPTTTCWSTRRRRARSRRGSRPRSA